MGAVLRAAKEMHELALGRPITTGAHDTREETSSGTALLAKGLDIHLAAGLPKIHSAGSRGAANLRNTEPRSLKLSKPGLRWQGIDCRPGTTPGDKLFGARLHTVTPHLRGDRANGFETGF